MLISFHNNGWDGTLTGTETYWDYNNHPGSQALATAVHNNILSKIRTYYDSSWYSRGIKTSYDAYGEINYAQMPAALIELAFMDTPYPDNAYLHDEYFKKLAAEAIAEGICAFLGENCDLTLQYPTLSPAYGSGVCDSGWLRFVTTEGDNAHLMLNVADAAASEHTAAWQPDLPSSGEYRVEVFIPDHDSVYWSCPGVTTTWDTRSARYELTYANGTARMVVNQAPLADEWVDLGTFHFNSNTAAALTLSDVTGEADHTTSVSASSVRFTLVGQEGVEFYNTAWLEKTWATDQVNVPVENIRNFFDLFSSCLAEPILDSDGVEIDPPVLLQQAAADNQISPKPLLAIMEAQQSALSACPDPSALSSLMGLAPASTAREQIAQAAQMLGTAYSQLNATGTTPNGWSAGAPKDTLDGVTVTPANDSVALLFDYFQTAGEIWGGDQPGEAGAASAYIAYRDYHLSLALPENVYRFYIPGVLK